MITSTPGVCGGDPCVGNTRIPVWLLVNAKYCHNQSDEQLLKDYPSLTQSDLDEAWDYFRQHPISTSRLIFENERA